jgi:type III restriction enzyme
MTSTTTSAAPKNAVDNPILNSPFLEPAKHWDFSGPVARVANGRRAAGYTGVARTERGGEVSRAEQALIELQLVNEIRHRVKQWRDGGYSGATRITRDLLEHWNRADRRPIFFCQREAAETIIWLVEASIADRAGIQIPEDRPEDVESLKAGYPALVRYCTKLATGAGKTTVMAMIAAWSILNRVANKMDGRFTDAILVVAPNLTVKERLAVLNPRVPANYYEKFDLIPAGYRDHIKRGRVVITNWHVFAVKDDSGKRSIVKRGRESDSAFVKRVLKELGGAQQILVFNDEAHHAWRPTAPIESASIQQELKGLDRYEKQEAEEFAEEATVWVGGLDRINKVLGRSGQRGIKFVLDLSATPFALKGSGRPEGEPLPWIVSDFGLVDAIESGITKVPRIPVRDDSGRPDAQYFRLWQTVKAKLERSGEWPSGKAQPKPDAVYREAQPALAMLAAKWKATFQEFQKTGQPVPPAMIVVAQNTSIAAVIAESIIRGDILEDLKGDEVTFQIDSRVLKQAEADTSESDAKAPAKTAKDSTTKPDDDDDDDDVGDGADVTALPKLRKRDHQQLLRLRVATVGKPEWEGGSPPPVVQNLAESWRRVYVTPPGKDVRCVVSVGMLTEGWDAQNVTQILGLRAFSSQLLCEQVVGRALRRMSYEVDDSGVLQPEYADIFGVPFEVIPVQGTGTKPPEPPKLSTLIQAVPERKKLAIEFPRVEGYVRDVKARIKVGDDVVDEVPILRIEPTAEPTRVHVTPKAPTNRGEGLGGAVGGGEELTREQFYVEHRQQRTEFDIAASIVRALAKGTRPDGTELSFRPDANSAQLLFPQVLDLVHRYVERRVALVGDARIGELALDKYKSVVVGRLLEAIEPDENAGEAPQLPRIERHRPVGSTNDVLFRTTKGIFQTKRSHLSHAVVDSTWEGQAVFHLERDDLDGIVLAYAKNDRLDFTIPYVSRHGESEKQHAYVPDFLVRVGLDDGSELNLILETKGWKTETDRTKQTAAERWVRAVNNHGGFGRWMFQMVEEPAGIPELLRSIARPKTFTPRPAPTELLEPDDWQTIVVEQPKAPAPDAPRRQDWADWVAASRTRNFMLRDPLLDWLGLYGEQRGFARDDTVPGFDERTDFSRFIFQKANDFERKVVEHFQKAKLDVATIAKSPGETRDPTKVLETVAAMKAGIAVIYQGVLHDEGTRTYGAPDLLVRSDVLERLFPDVYETDAAWFDARFGEQPREPIGRIGADGLGKDFHYRVVDVKFTTLHLLKSGEMSNEGSGRAYKAQLFLYNRALGRAQGYQPVSSFLLGRGWEQGEARGRSALERLAVVPQDCLVARSKTLSDEVEAAVQWMRRVRSTGASWEVLPTPLVDELRPNMKNASDAPWHGAKRRIATELRDLTLLPQVGVDKRDAALVGDPPLRRWDDPKLTPELVGVKGAKTKPILERVLDVNRDGGPEVWPARVTVAENEWREPEKVEFFVDFETVSDLDDDFAAFPEKGGQPLIFMVGCGHVEHGDWVFRCFVADALDEDAEARVLDDWFAHMAAVQKRLGVVDEPKVFHWSPAEVSNLESAYNAAKRRHPERSWPVPLWFDFLNRVVKAEPFCVKGAWGFGLKAIGKALHAQGKITTMWGDGPTDGLGAMVGAWVAAREAQRSAAQLRAIPLMREIERYNEVDCRVMHEVIDFVRKWGA